MSSTNDPLIGIPDFADAPAPIRKIGVGSFRRRAVMANAGNVSMDMRPSLQRTRSKINSYFVRFLRARHTSICGRLSAVLGSDSLLWVRPCRRPMSRRTTQYPALEQAGRSIATQSRAASAHQFDRSLCDYGPLYARLHIASTSIWFSRRHRQLNQRFDQ